MHRWKAFLFDRFRVERDGDELDQLHTRRAKELLAYLLLHPTHHFQRDNLARTLWPDHAAPRRIMRQSIWQLQQALNDDPLIDADTDTIGIDPRADLWIDAAFFRQACISVAHVPGGDLSTAQRQALHESVNLYRGDLLEGWYQEWNLLQREHFQNLYLAALDKLMTACETHAEYENGIEYGDRILLIDRAHEYTHQRMIRFFYLSGDRTAALRQYERCVSALRTELDVLPSRQTETLVAAIRAGQMDVPGLDTGRASAWEMLGTLGALRQRIARLQNKLSQRTISD